MKILFLGGDQRQLEIIKGLYEKGYKFDVVGYDEVNIPQEIRTKKLSSINISDYQVIILPVKGINDDFSVTSVFSKEEISLTKDFFEQTRSDVQIITGIRSRALISMLKGLRRELVVLMEDEDIVKENSVPTVEGIIGDLIFNTEWTIKGSNILVLGYGNVGRLLVDILRKMGAEVTVGVKLTSDHEELRRCKTDVIFTSDRSDMVSALNRVDVVINTVPALILDEHYLRVTNKDVYILDISSFPHGIDFNIAKALNLRHKLFSGIPAIVAPKTAGRILIKKIRNRLGGVNNG